MARPIRVEFEGAVYHVTARGNERRDIYRDDADRELFLATLGQCIEQHGLRVHGYCLMPNHYHLLVETPRGNLSRAMGWMQTAYTIRFNRRHKRSGHLFQGRFKAHLVEADAYGMTLLRYVHLNPVRPRAKSAPVPAERRNTLAQYRWSSHGSYTGAKTGPKWLNTDWLSFFGRSRRHARMGYRRFMEEAFVKPVESPWEELRFGLVMGGKSLLERVSGILKKKPGEEEVAWTARQERMGERAMAAGKVPEGQSERKWKAWVLVRYGNMRNVDVARQLGFKDGSAITHLLRRIEESMPLDRASRQHAAALEREFNDSMSCFKS